MYNVDQIQNCLITWEARELHSFWIEGVLTEELVSHQRILPPAHILSPRNSDIPNLAKDGQSDIWQQRERENSTPSCLSGEPLQYIRKIYRPRILPLLRLR